MEYAASPIPIYVDACEAGDRLFQGSVYIDEPEDWWEEISLGSSIVHGCSSSSVSVEG